MSTTISPNASGCVLLIVMGVMIVAVVSAVPVAPDCAFTRCAVNPVRRRYFA
ncbi:MAG: hypothetical protein AB7V25_04920 [Mangrovibacterium sp.]